MADNYRLPHQAPGPEEDGTTISLDQVGSASDEVFPPDVLKNPKNYGLKHSSTAAALNEAQDNPETEIRIWRAVPNGVTTINPGDWVSLSKEYAEAEAQLEGAQVITTTAQAKDLWTEGLLEEWGYQGKVPLKAAPESERRSKVLESFPAVTSEQRTNTNSNTTARTGLAQQTKSRSSELGY